MKEQLIKSKFIDNRLNKQANKPVKILIIIFPGSLFIFWIIKKKQSELNKIIRNTAGRNRIFGT
jgi:hypothetical protein